MEDLNFLKLAKSSTVWQAIPNFNNAFSKNAFEHPHDCDEQTIY